MIDFKENIQKLYSLMENCKICPHECKAKRNKGQCGFCKSSDKVFIASQNIHFGEEPPISGQNGSGTIFFSNCVLKCVFCQNYPISQIGSGNEISVEKLAEIMLSFQNKGVHNINLVSPTHYTAQIAAAIFSAKSSGLKIPIVFNCGGYERVETLKLVDGLVDIYLPDVKYSNNEIAFKYSGVKNYVEINKSALEEMKRQVGHLECDNNGIAKKGLLVRHLVLPGNIENTKNSLNFIAQNLSKNTFVSLMAQYHPAHNSFNFKELSRRLNSKEYNAAKKYLNFLEIENGWVQHLE
jgi:putative pyruvate formate lyase activating enzyme